MFQSARQRNRVVFAPPMLNPYEEGVFLDVEDGDAMKVERQLKSSTGSATIVNDAMRMPEGPAPCSGRSRPPGHAPTGVVRRWPTPLQAPNSRGPNSATVVVNVDANHVNTSTDKALQKKELYIDTQRPRSSRFVCPSRDKFPAHHQPNRRNSGMANTFAQGSLKCEGNGGVEMFPVTTSPSAEAEAGTGAEGGQGFMAQSAFTQKNPFRLQTFEAFLCNPDYGVPPDLRVFPPGGMSEWFGLERAAEGEFSAQHHVMNPPRRSPGTSSTYSLAGSALGALQAGDWFLKWTRRGEVHERYVWLDVQRGALLWSPGPRPSLVPVSQLKLGNVMDLRPDCVLDTGTQCTLYRFFFVTQERTIVMATEMRDKFDLWFVALQKIILAQGPQQEWGQLWESPRAVAVAAADPKWESRCSPLHSILHGYGAATGVAGFRSGFSGGRGQVLPSD